MTVRPDATTNYHTFPDEKATEFSNLWFAERHNVTRAQADKVGVAQLKHILGIPEEIITGFLSGASGYSCYIGQRQGGMEPSRYDYKSFWTEVREVAPLLVPEQDLQWIIDSNDGDRLLLYMLEGKSSVIRSMAITAHAYK